MQGMCLYVKIFKSLYIVNAAVLIPTVYGKYGVGGEGGRAGIPAGAVSCDRCQILMHRSQTQYGS